MADRIDPKQFHESEGVEDWRLVGDELPGVEDHKPDVDLRRDGVTVRLITLRPRGDGGGAIHVAVWVAYEHGTRSTSPLFAAATDAAFSICTRCSRERHS